MLTSNELDALIDIVANYEVMSAAALVAWRADTDPGILRRAKSLHELKDRLNEEYQKSIAAEVERTELS